MNYKIERKFHDQEHLEIRISGDICIHTSNHVLEECKMIMQESSSLQVTLNMSEVKYFDAAGAAFVFAFKNLSDTKKVCITNMSSSVQGLLQLFNEEKIQQPTLKQSKKRGIIAQVGETTWQIIQDLKEAITFLGDLLIGIAKVFTCPHQIRWREIFFYMERSGSDAVPIVLLINFLIGLIMAFQSSVQLRQFGANIFVADLVGISLVRELGPLMTALIVAGRSGSAFAAEIGTMKVSEEVDALTTMGFDPMRFLVIPKFFAVVIMIPCLTILADLVGIIGGAIIGVTVLDLTTVQYINQTYKALMLNDIFSGLLKSMIFGALIAGIGCFRGFQVRGGAESVGRYTTSAVVTSIFSIILADAIYTVVTFFLPGG